MAETETLNPETLDTYLQRFIEGFTLVDIYLYRDIGRDTKHILFVKTINLWSAIYTQVKKYFYNKETEGAIFIHFPQIL